MASTAYKKLEEKFETHFLIKSSIGILDWDRMVKMPPGGKTLRARQTALLEGLAHDHLPMEEVGDLLSAAHEDKDTLNAWEQANLTHMQRLYHHEASIPRDIAAACSTARVQCASTWQDVRDTGDFEKIEGVLSELITLQKEGAQIKGQAMGLSPYDALLDKWDPWNTVANIDPLFKTLEESLPDLLDSVIDKQATEELPLPLNYQFEPNEQLAFVASIVKSTGFNDETGRLDVTHHPFSKGLVGDVRITTAYDPKSIIFPLMAGIHEAGHALFDGNAPAEWLGQPVGNSNNMGQRLHESQALIFEKCIGRSLPFWIYASDMAKSHFNVSGPEWSAENLQRLSTRVEKSYIRNAADEITYLLHIILRYNLEKMIFLEDLPVKDIPDVWNAEMQRLIGISPGKDQSKGCMRDIHWFEAYFGYFSTYALGAALASQLYSKVQTDINGLDSEIEKGNLECVGNWLKDNIHCHGALRTPNALIEKVLGTPICMEHHVQYLKNRYLY